MLLRDKCDYLAKKRFFWDTLYTDLNERENREMKICDEHFHFYDILLGGFETKPVKKNTKSFNMGNRGAEHGLWLFHCNLLTNEPQSQGLVKGALLCFRNP